MPTSLKLFAAAIAMTFGLLACETREEPGSGPGLVDGPAPDVAMPRDMHNTHDVTDRRDAAPMNDLMGRHDAANAHDMGRRDAADDASVGDEGDPANTGNHRQDGERALNPTDQSEDPIDLKVTASLRRDLVGDSSLSMNAKNVKIITADGVVTLRGVVASDDERRRVGRMATTAAAGRRVDNQLEVTGKNTPPTL